VLSRPSETCHRYVVDVGAVCHGCATRPRSQRLIEASSFTPIPLPYGHPAGSSPPPRESWGLGAARKVAAPTPPLVPALVSQPAFSVHRSGWLLVSAGTLRSTAAIDTVINNAARHPSIGAGRAVWLCWCPRGGFELCRPFDGPQPDRRPDVVVPTAWL
jgi:hypothetical protein